MTSLMDVDEVAAALRKPRSWVYDAVRDGRLPAYRVGQALRFDPAEVVAWLRERRTDRKVGR